MFLLNLCSYWSCCSYWFSIPTVPTDPLFLLILLFLPILCSYWSSVPTVPSEPPFLLILLFLLILCSYWSYCSFWPSVPTDRTVPADPLFLLILLRSYQSSVSTHPLFLLFLCSYWSSFPADPTDPVFLQCTLILTISLWRQLGHRTPAMSQFRLMAWIEFEWPTWEFQLWSDFISDVELFMCRI